MANVKTLAGRIAVVTGGQRGIGAAIAAELAVQGARVVIGARSCQADADAHPACHPLDLASSASVAAFLDWVTRHFGPPDILVNNAGITTHQPVDGHDEAAWAEVVDVNLNGPFRMIRGVLAGMKTKGRGAIVNIASTAARSAEPDYGAYCASKAGLLGLTRVVAREGAPHGITCNAVSPTWVETDMLRAAAAERAETHGTDRATEIAALARTNPQGRLVQPGEIAALVAFLCSGQAPALTMEDIQVNAGAHW